MRIFWAPVATRSEKLSKNKVEKHKAKNLFLTTWALTKFRCVNAKTRIHIPFVIVLQQISFLDKHAVGRFKYDI